jgi:sugar phosphate permease
MASALTPAHHTWRVRVFVSTWLAYIGFYFCRKPFSAAKAAIQDETGWSTTTLGNIWAAYLFAYMIGQFLASGMGTWLGPRRNVLLGMVLSILVTVAMGVALDAWVMAGLVAVNGLAQATGWSGNVGTMAAWFHKHERGKVMGIWSTNFTLGSLLSGYAMAFVLGVAPWPWCFYVGAAVLTVIAINFFVFQRNRPEDVGLAPVDDPVTAVDESVAPDVPSSPTKLSRDAWINILLVGGFYFFAKFVRYAVWSWSAFFLAQHYKLADSQANVYATAFDIVGLPAVFITGWLSDTYFGSRRAGISLIMMCGLTVSTALLVQFGDSGVAVFAILLAAVGFTLYGPDALLTGAGAMDIGGRKAATFATAIIAGFGAAGPIVQEVVIARMYDSKHGDLGPIFELLFGSAVLATLFCGLLVWRNRRGGKGI